MRSRNYLRAIPFVVTSLLNSQTYSNLEDNATQLNNNPNIVHSTNGDYSPIEKLLITGSVLIAAGSVLALIYWKANKREENAEANGIDVETLDRSEGETRRS